MVGSVAFRGDLVETVGGAEGGGGELGLAEGFEAMEETDFATTEGFELGNGGLLRQRWQGNGESLEGCPADHGHEDALCGNVAEVGTGWLGVEIPREVSRVDPRRVGTDDQEVTDGDHLGHRRRYGPGEVAKPTREEEHIARLQKVPINGGRRMEAEEARLPILPQLPLLVEIPNLDEATRPRQEVVHALAELEPLLDGGDFGERDQGEESGALKCAEPLTTAV